MVKKPLNYPDKIIYNPDSDNFTITYDLEGTNHPKSYTIYSKEYGTFPAPVSDHIQNHLARHLVFKRGVKTNFEDEYNKTLKEIEYVTK